MTQFTLSSKTQSLINKAIDSGPGTNNINYLNAYNAIYGNMQAESAGGQAINAGVMNWFSQAGLVNTFTFSSNATGLFIYSYTQGAAATFGVNLTYSQLQAASNQIAASVFKSLQDSNYSFSDTGNFSIQNVVRQDAGSGISYLQSLFPQAHLDFSMWGGTLFARTVLNDPTYFSDYKINLTPGQQDCEAIEQGLVTALAKEAAGGYFSGLPTFPQRDFSTIGACVRLQGSMDGQTQFASALQGGSAGFALKDAQLISALAPSITRRHRQPS